MNNKLLPIDFVDSMTNYMMFEKGSSISWRVVKVSDIRAMLSAAPDVAGEVVAWMLKYKKTGATFATYKHADMIHFLGTGEYDVTELYTTPQPDRTAELEDKVKRLVEALKPFTGRLVLVSKSVSDNAMAQFEIPVKCFRDADALLAEINETSGFIGGEV